MEKFLLEHYYLLTYTLEAMAALTGVFFYKKYKHSSAKYFIWFLVYIAVCDFANSYTTLVFPDKALGFLLGTKIEKNFWFSTLYWKVGAILFITFYYNQILKTPIFKVIIKWSGYDFLGFSVIYIACHWDAFFVSYFPILSVLGAIIVFMSTVFYFLEVLQSEALLTFYTSLNFYISAAIFIWWLIITPIVFYDNYTNYEILVYERDWAYIHLRRLIYITSNIFMYLTFTFSLIWCRPQNK